jgi:hypothetical protein
VQVDGRSLQWEAPVGDARRPVRQTGCDAQFTPLRSRSAIADHLHTDAVTEITFTTPPGLRRLPELGQVVGRQHRAVAITPTFLERS